MVLSNYSPVAATGSWNPKCLKASSGLPWLATFVALLLRSSVWWVASGKDVFSFDTALNYALAARGWSVAVWEDLAAPNAAFLCDQGFMAEHVVTGDTVH